MPPSMQVSCLRSALSRSTASLSNGIRAPRACFVAKWLHSRGFTTQETVPLRKGLKDEAKRKKAEARAAGNNGQKKIKVEPQLDKWELTVGIEIHAELNTACKLFSDAPASDLDGSSAGANSRVALFDAALPGSQPQFQRATLLPALRAAIALGCEVQRVSGWDRKHYFHWDQPNGYQITQYYAPLAKDGSMTLTPTADGIPISDLPSGTDILTIGIKQVQLEQDTAKTTHPTPAQHHVDLNRAGHPLIEIITLPEIHSPSTAAAVVRKIQAMLKSVDACVAGMETGGLRADVNVSVRQRGTQGTGSAYSGVSGLGTRTEIKNLASFKAVEDAIVAERERQISVLEAGGDIEGETRGWTLGAAETTRLRGKEGEVDYRYMPDADLAPLVVGEDLVRYLRETLPELPNATVERLQSEYGLNVKDAKTFVALDDGERVEFLAETVEILAAEMPEDGPEPKELGRTVANWILHELGGLLTSASSSVSDPGSESSTAWTQMPILPAELASLLHNLLTHQITARTAKSLLATLYTLPPSSERPTVSQLIEAGDLRITPLSGAAYEALARVLLEENEAMVAGVRKVGREKGRGKVMWFVGRMVRRGEEQGGGTVQAERAKEVVEELLFGDGKA